MKDLAKAFRSSPETFARSLENVFDEGGFAAALNSETGIVDGRAALLAACRAVNRIVFCLETITQSKLEKGASLPDW